MRIPNQPVTISGLAPSSMDETSSRRAQQGGAAGSETSGATSTGSASETTLSASSVGLTTQALGQPDIRSARVASLQDQIAAGTYQVPATSLAQALMGDPMTGLDGDGDST